MVKAAEGEYAFGLISRSQFDLARRAAHNLFAVKQISQPKTAEEHRALLAQIVRWLRSEFFITLGDDEGSVAEFPRTGFGWILRERVLPLSQLESSMVWLAVAQQYELPVFGFLANERRFIVWDTGTLRYVLHPVNGKPDESVRCSEHPSKFSRQESYYLGNLCLAYLLSANGRYDEAWMLLRPEADQTSPAFMDTYFARLCGEVHLRLGSVPDALQWYSRAVELYPDVQNCDTVLRLLVEQNRMMEAVAVLIRSLQRIPYAQKRPIYALLAQAFELIGDMGSAVEAKRMADPATAGLTWLP
ncbi:MAG: hypothetical protein ACRD7E_11120 [Bryobacteraceae bacterium]